MRNRPIRWLTVAATTVFASAGLGALAPALADAPTTRSTTAVTRTAESIPAKSRYVALGDSYASGPLVPVQYGHPIGCGRSTNNYANVLARTGDLELTDVTCGGAVTENMLLPQQTAPLPNAPQFEALNGSESLVTITIGGNDIGFGEILGTCPVISSANLAGAACKDYYTAGGEDRLDERIENTAPKVADVLAGITERSPNARVAVVGYPTVLPAEGPGCYPTVPVSAGDTAYLRGIVAKLNGMLAEEADEAGVDFVDTAGPSVGHDYCQPPEEKWLEGIVPTEAATPVHPNARGYRSMAAATGAVVGIPVEPPSSPSSPGAPATRPAG